MKRIIAMCVLTGLICPMSVFASETFNKIDDNKVKIANTVEQNYTYEDLQNRIILCRSERDLAQNKADSFNAELIRLEAQLVEIEKAGVKPKPVLIEGEIGD